MKKVEQLYLEKIMKLIAEKENVSDAIFETALLSLIKKIARDQDLLTFDERLELSKEEDMY
jgi:hypothetical protein